MNELNPIYEEAWNKVAGAGSYYYADPDKIETSGKPLVFPCLFRLLRTTDTITQGRYYDRYTRVESFLLCAKVEDFPDLDEEAIELRVMEMARAFLTALQKDGRVSFAMPGSFTWFRRNLQQFAICLNFELRVTPTGRAYIC